MQQQEYFPQQQEEIDERIDVLDFNQTYQEPIQSPDLLKYFISQLLLTRNSPGSSNLSEDWMFKEQVIALYQKDL